MYVFDALRGGLLEHLLYDELADVRPLHRRQRYREVVEGDGQLHAGEEKLVQRLHAHRLQERALDRHVRLGERLEGTGGVDHARAFRQLLVVEAVPRVEHHRGTVLLEDGRETRAAHLSSSALVAVIKKKPYVPPPPPRAPPR